MPRFFNTAGPCRPDVHYMLPPERRLGDVREMIDKGLYFVLHAPRQVGKTTSLRALAERLAAEGGHAAVLTSCEVGQKLDADLDGSIAGILDTLRQDAAAALPAELRPPAADPAVPAETRLLDLLSRWARDAPRPVVLFLDEIDALYDDALISVLRQLRSGFARRPKDFPLSIALIGLRDVRDYRIRGFDDGDGDTLGTSSPFNVKSDSLTLRPFSAEEIAELYAQHTEETGQRFAAEATAHVFTLTQGQPWLVNALARQLVENLVTDRGAVIVREDVERAKEVLIQRRDTHLDSLVDRLWEPRVRRVIEPILTGEMLRGDVLDDDVQFALDLGLVSAPHGNLEIANPIYREVVPRALTRVMELTIALPRPSYKDVDGRLRTGALLEDFSTFWLEHAEWFLDQAPYSEAAAQLIFMAYLQRVVNGGGTIEREYGVGRGRLDLCVRWPLPGGKPQRWAIELKVWRRGANPTPKGVEQLGAYLERLGLDAGTLILFDSRPDIERDAARRILREEHVHDGRRVDVLRLA